MAKRRGERPDFLVSLFEMYRRRHPGDIEIKDVVSWALENDHLPGVDHQQLLIAYWKQRMGSALNSEEDGNGVRVYINSTVNGRSHWNRRTEASWHLRQGYIFDQLRRERADREKNRRMFAQMQSERRFGEPEFQLTLDFETEPAPA
jgi:hypothetical protein